MSRYTKHRTYHIGSRMITITTGSEGSPQDRYEYTEYSIKQRGCGTITYHEGLGMWLRYNAEGDETKYQKIFEKHLGCSLRNLERVIKGTISSPVRDQARKGEDGKKEKAR